MISDRIASSALYQQVADRLRRRIYQHQLAPGQGIDEKALSQEFGISRTPMREALKVLHAEGLVELIPRRGCFVKQLDGSELDELFPVVAVLEGLGAREAANRLGPADLERLETSHARLEALAAEGDIDGYYDENFRFHEAVHALAGNRWLLRVVGDLRKVLRLARHDQLTVPGRLAESLQEHRRLMEAFRNRDPSLADRCMQEHLLQQRRAWQALARSTADRPAV